MRIRYTLTVIRPADLIRKYYATNPKAWELLLAHSRLVCKRALKVASNLAYEGSLDHQFLAEAAMLHDIGMIFTDTPDLYCQGDVPYIRHGVIGRELLEEEGWPRHARVCERHIGIGLTAAEIRQQNLDLPCRDMLPETLEEQIICYADLFYSKGKKHRHREKNPEQVRKSLAKFGTEKIKVFNDWQRRFEPDLN